MISIGSDFDGFIDPILQCRTALEFKACERFIVRNIDRLYMGFNMPPYQTLLQGYTIKEVMRKVFYENLKDFLLLGKKTNYAFFVLFAARY